MHLLSKCQVYKWGFLPQIQGPNHAGFSAYQLTHGCPSKYVFQRAFEFSHSLLIIYLKHTFYVLFCLFMMPQILEKFGEKPPTVPDSDASIFSIVLLNTA